MGDFADLPVRVHLNIEPRPDWLSDEQISEFLSLGYEMGHAFSIPEMPQVEIQTFFNAMGVGAVLYNNDSIGNWVDLCAYTENLEFTVSSAPMGGEMDTQEYAKKLFLPNASLLELNEKLVQELQGLTISRCINRDNFRENFENDYARDMDWRIKKGGLSEDEYRRIAESSDVTLNTAQDKQAFFEIKLSEWQQWGDDAVEKFMKDNSERNGICFFYSSQIPSSILPDYLDEHLAFSERQLSHYKELAEGLSTEQLFIRILEAISPSIRPQNVQDVDYPVPGTIYTFSS